MEIYQWFALFLLSNFPSLAWQRLVRILCPLSVLSFACFILPLKLRATIDRAYAFISITFNTRPMGSASDHLGPAAAYTAIMVRRFAVSVSFLQGGLWSLFPIR